MTRSHRPPLLPAVPADHPPPLYPDYKSTVKRSYQHPPITVPETLSEQTGPGPSWSDQVAPEADLTTNAGTGSPALGERIIVTGRVLDEHGRPVARTAVEVWQANAGGRYRHWRATDFDAPLDPNFLGVGRVITAGDGTYRFTTIRPGAYPWGNHPNAWRPPHIHFSLLGDSLPTRLVTQMYFPGDPLLSLDPIYQSVPIHSRTRLLAHYDHQVTVPHWALGYRWDIVLRGRDATPKEP